MSIFSSFSDEPPSLAMDPSESSSKRNSSSGDEPSSASMDADDHSSDAISRIPSGDEHSSATMDIDDHSSDVIPNIPSDDEPSVVYISSAGSSEDAVVDVATGFVTFNSNLSKLISGFTCDELVFQALSPSYYEADGIGLDFDEIYKYIEERQELPEYFREQLIDELGDLIVEGQIQKVGNRYKISPGILDTTKSEETEDSSNQTQSMSSEHSTNSQDQASTSSIVPTSSEETPDIDAAAKPSTSSSVPTSSEQNPDAEATAKAVAVSDHSEFEAEKASQLYDTSLQLLNENSINLSLAKELLCQCNVLPTSTSSSSISSSSLPFCFVHCRY